MQHYGISNEDLTAKFDVKKPVDAKKSIGWKALHLEEMGKNLRICTNFSFDDHGVGILHFFNEFDYFYIKIFGRKNLMQFSRSQKSIVHKPRKNKFGEEPGIFLTPDEVEDKLLRLWYNNKFRG